MRPILQIATLFLITSADEICPNESSEPSTVCPDGFPCCKNKYSPNGYGCATVAVDDPNLVYCCTPGPKLNASSSVPNVMILGDSVSIGYTPYVVNNLSADALIQHSPWDVSDGGACNTSYGLSCLPIFLKSASQQFIAWDLIQFNFGLHDLDNSSNGEQAYINQLQQITESLMEFDNGKETKTKLQYALTTPLMSDYNIGNYVVEDDNKLATQLMKNYSIPIVDLYQRVVDFCGPVPYINCSICALEPCTFHYNQQGYEWIAGPINTEIKQQLGLKN